MEEEEEEEEEEEMSTTTTITVFLPQDIIMDILSRLPANSLVSSFKFVCKAWRTLIHNPAFVKMHLNRRLGGGVNSNDNSNSSLFCKSGKRLYLLHPPFNYVDRPIAAAKKLDFELVSSTSDLVGSCNGLLCIRDYHDNGYKKGMVILNPSTSKYKVLPEEPGYKTHNAYGFGCCYTNDDYEYKVVRIACFFPVCYKSLDPSNYEFHIDIYSMSSNSWKRTREGIKDFPALISRFDPAIFLNGALHWTGSSIHHGSGGPRGVIVSFDLRDEDYRLIVMPQWQPPSCFIHNKAEYTMLINLRGCLGIIFVSNSRDHDIWVMKEYGIRESWTRECVIKATLGPLETREWSITKVCFLKGDQILIDLGSHGRTALYDMNSKKIDMDFKMVGVPYGNRNILFNQGLADYIETLVSPIEIITAS